MADADGSETAEPDVRLDLRGLHCPMPVLRARKALRQVPVGSAVVLECTDPLSAIDVPHFAVQDGHRLTDQRREGALQIFRIIRGR